MASAELSKSRSLVILAVVVGCFAVLWPNVFYPMFQNNNETPSRLGKDSPAARSKQSVCCGVVFESDASDAFLAEICSLVLKHDLAMELTTLPLEHGGRLPDSVVTLCREELWKKCAIDVDHVVKSDVDGVVDRKRKIKGLRKQNLTECLKLHFDIDEDALMAKKSHVKPVVLYPRHMRPERHPPHLHPENMHPALREKGRVLPVRTIEKQAKPGPMPGMRPPMGGAGHVVPASTGNGVGILMPIYTIGIVIFFLYTMMRIMFKKPEDNEPRTKDFLLDAEQRKFIFAEEYCSSLTGLIPDITAKDCALIQERLEQKRRSRSKTPEVYNKEDLEPIPENVMKEEAVEEEVQEKTIAKTDDSAPPMGEWCLREDGPVNVDESQSDLVDRVQFDGAVDERKLLLAYAALKAQKDDEVDQLRRRLEETERAMERIVAQMGNVSEKLMPIISTDSSANADKEPDETVANQPESPISEKGVEEVDNDAQPLSSSGDAVAEVEELLTDEAGKNTQGPESTSEALADKTPEEAPSVQSQQSDTSCVEETPIEQAEVEGTPVEDAPIQQAPLEETLTEPTPVEQSPAEETPVEHAPVEETSVEQTSVEQTSEEQTSVEQTPVEQSPTEETPIEQAAVEETSVEQTPVEQSLAEETPIEQATVEGTPVEEPKVEASVNDAESSIEPHSAENTEQQLEDDIINKTTEGKSEAATTSEVIPDECADHHLTEDCPIDDLCLELREAVKSIGEISDEQVDQAPISARQSSEERKLTVVGMDVMAAMEDGRKMAAELLPRLDKPSKTENADPLVQEPIPSVFLDASIPAESHLVVSEAECRAEAVPVEQLDLDAAEYESSPVVLSGKMTLSVIGVDNPPEEGTVSESKKITEEESDSGHRVRFAPQLTDHIFLIPVAEQDEAPHEEPSLPVEEEDEDAAAKRENQVDYRPPTPPLPHLSDNNPITEENEFLTYEELEEAGEIEVEEVVQPEVEEEETIRADVKEICQPEILLDIEYQLIPTSSNTSLDTIASQTSADEFPTEETAAPAGDMEKDREIDVVEHGLEQIPAVESQQVDKEPAVEASQEQPTISSFTIREEMAEDDIGSQITEEEILQARKEIEEIKQLLAGVSNDVINQQDLVSVSSPPDASPVSDDIVVQLANAMVEETGGNQSAASKGSSPDMEDYEVIATESKDPAAEVGSEIHPEQDARITSTTAENESKDST